MGKKQLWMIIAGLFMLNVLMVAYYFSKFETFHSIFTKDEVVASIGNQRITRQEWLSQLEARYGKDVLKAMIDQKVIEEMADKYRIKIPEQDVEREYLKLKSSNAFAEKEKKSDLTWKKQIRNNLLLEELLTKDVEISNKELFDYYKNNKGFINIPDAYHLSHIIVKTKEEAETARKELKQGSGFAALAMELSIDELSANQGGDIGFITNEEEQYPSSYIETAKNLQKGQISQPIQVEQGYAIIKLEEKIKGKKFKFAEVKGEIRRQLALQQMKTAESASVFWNEAKVDWFYGKTGTGKNK